MEESNSPFTEETTVEEALITLNDQADKARMMKSLQEDHRFITLFV